VAGPGGCQLQFCQYGASVETILELGCSFSRISAEGPRLLRRSRAFPLQPPQQKQK